MTDMPRQLGRYQLLRRLATGGMGEIYLARTTGAGGFEKQVIIKTILPHLARQEEFVTKFLDEGRIVVQLTHGNIVPVFDMGEEDGEYFIAMEYVAGLDLRAILKRLDARQERLPIELALFVAAELCKGLGYAHRKTDDDGNSLDIVHRDVSPSNVLVSREGEVKIIDFGIARAAGKVAETASGRIQGKCCYMSPEQARGRSLDARSDIFSTGVLLYEMLTLTRPFEGRSDLESLELVRNCDTDPPGVLRPAIPEEVDAIVSRAMAKEPDDRYQTIDEMHVDLQQELYRLDHSVTSQRLAEDLDDVFTDAREEAAARLTDETDPPTPANLDEALEMQLAHLEGVDDGSPSSLPLAPTATGAAHETNTITPGASTPGTPMERPGVDAGEHGEAADVDSRFDADAFADAGHQTDDEPGDDADIEPNTGQVTAPVRRRYWLPATIAAGVAGAAAVTAVLLLRPEPEATLQLHTDPPGAAIYLDGEPLAGRQTPEELSLPGDTYEVEIALEDFESEPRNVHLSSGESLSLSGEDFDLRPVSAGPRTFVVTTDPEDARLSVDDREIDSLPHELTLDEDETATLTASADDCHTITHTLTHHYPDERIELPLECDDGEDEEAVGAELHAERPTLNQPRTPPVRAPRQSVEIDTEPEGASIAVDGDELGSAPVDTSLADGDEITIEAQMEGYESLHTTVDSDDFNNGRLELQLEQLQWGCLNFRAREPAHNKIAINDEWLDDRHMSLQEHPLPAGPNTITVHHPETDKKESFDIDIEAGSQCKALTVWKPD